MSFFGRNIVNYSFKTLSIFESLRTGIYCSYQSQSGFQSVKDEQKADYDQNKEDFKQEKNHEYNENNDKNKRYRFYSNGSNKSNYSFNIVIPLLVLMGQKLNSVSCLFGFGPEVIIDPKNIQC